MCAYTHTINVDICQTVQVCIKLFVYINTYFSYLNEPDKAWSITTSILLFDLVIHFTFYSKLFTFGLILFSFGQLNLLKKIEYFLFDTII